MNKFGNYEKWTITTCMLVCATRSMLLWIVKKFHVVNFFVFTKYYPSENISMRTQGIDTAMGSIFGGSDLGSNLA